MVAKDGRHTFYRPSPLMMKTAIDNTRISSKIRAKTDFYSVTRISGPYGPLEILAPAGGFPLLTSIIIFLALIFQ